MKIEVLPPDINESFKNFAVIGNQIRFGLTAVKNVGDAAIDITLVERKGNGKFKSSLTMLLSTNDSGSAARAFGLSLPRNSNWVFTPRIEG